MRRGKATFDPKIFLAKVGEGKIVSKYRKDQIVFSQGEVADAVFYIQQGQVKLTVVSEQGKEAVVAILGPGLRAAAPAAAGSLHARAANERRPPIKATRRTHL